MKDILRMNEKELFEAKNLIAQREGELKLDKEREHAKDEMRKLERDFKISENIPESLKEYYVYYGTGLSHNGASMAVSNEYGIFRGDEGINRFCLAYRKPKREVLKLMKKVDELVAQGKKHADEVRAREEQRYSKKKELTPEQKELLKV